MVAGLQRSTLTGSQTPTLMTTTSMPPSAVRTPSAADFVASASVTSTGSTCIRPLPTSSSSARRRALIATRAPRRTSSSASAAPMPLDAPITHTRAPASSLCIDGSIPNSAAGRRREHAADEHQWGADREPECERLTQEQYAEGDRHHRVDVGDDHRPRRPDFGDERKEDEECRRRTHEREREHRQRRLGTDL